MEATFALLCVAAIVCTIIRFNPSAEGKSVVHLAAAAANKGVHKMSKMGILTV